MIQHYIPVVCREPRGPLRQIVALQTGFDGDDSYLFVIDEENLQFFEIVDHEGIEVWKCANILIPPFSLFASQEEAEAILAAIKTTAV